MLQNTLVFSTTSYPLPQSLFPTASSPIPFQSFFSPTNFRQKHCLRLQWRPKKKRPVVGSAATYEVGGGYPDEELDAQDRRSEQSNEKLDPSKYEALLKGGEQVTSVLEEMIKLVSFKINFWLSEKSSEEI